MFKDIYIDADSDQLQLVGVRFETIQVPRGANIKNAFITFTVDPVDSQESDNTDVSADITIELLAISGELVERQWALTNRMEASGSTTTVRWQIPNTNSGEENSADISPLITELVSLDKWSARRNAPMFFFGRASGKGNRWFYSGTRTADAGPTLTVVYDDETTTVTTATTTTVTTTRTKDPAIAILQDKLAALETKLAAVGEGTVTVEQLQSEVKLIQESLVAIQARLDADADDFSTQIAALKQAQAENVAELKATLAEQALAFQAFITRPRVPPNIDDGSKDGARAPSVQSDEDNNLIMAAKGGKVIFESASCEAADLCQLQREHQSLMDKFQE